VQRFDALSRFFAESRLSRRRTFSTGIRSTKERDVPLTRTHVDSTITPLTGHRLTRRVALGSGATTLATGLMHRPAIARAFRLEATPSVSDPSDPADGIVAKARQIIKTNHLRAVILRVTRDGEELVTASMGESMTGVPADPNMRFRNGGVAISYMTTLLLRMVDQGIVTLDDSIDAWLPDLPDADRVTLKMLANMTSGYPDFVPDEEFGAAFYAEPLLPHARHDLQLRARRGAGRRPNPAEPALRRLRRRRGLPAVSKAGARRRHDLRRAGIRRGGELPEQLGNLRGNRRRAGA
jgi:hypothetical protein